MDGELNGKEEKAEEIKQKNAFPISRKLYRDMMYGFIVVFLFLIVYVVGQIQTMEMIKYVGTICPGSQVISASPFSGLVVMPPGGRNISERHSELGYDFANFSEWNFTNYTFNST